MFEAAARGAEWPITAPELFAAATAAIDAMHAAQVAASEALDSTMQARTETGWRHLAVTVVQISGLQRALVAILRSRVAELKRCHSDRVPAALQASLLHPGGTAVGVLRDLSPGGARFTGDAPSLSAARLQVAGLPETAVRVVGRSDGTLHLTFLFAADIERKRMAEAVVRLTAAPVSVLAA